MTKAIEDNVLAKDAASLPEQEGAYSVLTFNKGMKKMAYPLFLIGILLISVLTANHIDGTKPLSSLTTSDWLFLAAAIFGFIICPIWLFCHWHYYKILYNQTEFKIHPFLFREIRMPFSSIRKAEFYKHGMDLYVSGDAGKAKISGYMKGYRDFEGRIESVNSIQRHVGSRFFPNAN